MQPPSRILQGTQVGISPLLVEHENAGLAGKADFLHLSRFTDEHGIIRGFGAAVFPPAFGFGNNILASLNGGLVSFNLDAVFTSLQLGLAKFGGLRNVDGLGEWLCERRNSQGDGRQQGDGAEKRISLHACQFPFGQDRVCRIAGRHRPDGVDTQAADE